MLRFLTAGESHGKGLSVIIEGIPAGIPISSDFIAHEMAKRQKGAGSGGRMLIEGDKVEILSGVRFGKTLGSPICLLVMNNDSKNWGDKMSTEPQPDELVNSIKVVKPRPGHADLAGVQKYGYDDVRNVLERASARETTMRVAAATIFKQFLMQFGIEVASHTLQIGSIKLDRQDYTFDDIKNSYHNDPVIRCIDSSISKKMKDLIDKTRSEMNTLGGIVETWAINVPVGLGSHIHYDTKIDGQIAQAMMSIHSVKAVEIGSGVDNASQFGADVHDEIFYEQKIGYYRKTNRAGGVEGGITNGMPIVVRVYHKPISTLYKPMNTVNIQTKQPDKATVERSDICIVPRGGVVSEAMLSFVIAKNMLEKFGGDNLEDIKEAYKNYIQRIS